MKQPKHLFKVLLQGLLLSFCLRGGMLLSQTLPLSENLVNLNSGEGETFLIESDARTDYLPLTLHFVSQENLAYCGVASMVMVLNALDIPAPEAPKYRDFRVFTKNNGSKASPF